MPLTLSPAGAADRARLARIRAPAGMGRFVHFNWFWLDRALADPAIRLCLVRGGPRGGLTGCIAYGPHEPVDLDPTSRNPGIGEIFHLVIDRRHAGRGIGAGAVRAAIDALVRTTPALGAVRVSHHPDNTVAARLYARLGFIAIGEKIDGETGVRDRLLELPLPPSRRTSYRVAQETAT